MSFAAVILAAGSGSRAGPSPKQWRTLGGRPVLAWSVDAFDRAGANPIVVAVPAADLGRARAALAAWPRVKLIAGGETRVELARAALAVLAIAPPEAVLIHDAARPFVTPAHVARLLAALEDAEGAVPALAVADTLKRPGDRGALDTVDRAGLLRAQTPQAFRHDALAAAFAALPAGVAPTDDAAIVSAAGGKVVTVPGDPMLMKLTYPEDFAMAERLAGGAGQTRIGLGYDVHAFGPGDGVWLCGVRIAHDRGLVGHSDADAGLHALTDAVLGAAAEGDIGDHFPPSDPRWKGAASDQFLRHAVDLAAAKGGRLINVDVTLICEEPRIKAHREAMRARIAEITGLDIGAVSVKATTTEGLGFEGRREGIAAQAVVSLAFG